MIDITVPCLFKPRGHRTGKADPVQLPKKKKEKIPPSAPYGQAPGGAGWLVYVRVNLSARVAVAFCTADAASASCQAKPSFFFQVAMKRPAKKG